MAKRQFFGIKFPFTDSEFTNFFVDANMTTKDKVRSQIMHVIFTPKGQRLRRPEFGTDLIRYIFDPNDTESWSAVKTERIETVSRWIPNCTLKDIKVVQSEDDGREIFVRLDYSVQTGNYATNDSIIIQL